MARDEWRANLFYYSLGALDSESVRGPFQMSPSLHKYISRICLECICCWVPIAVSDGAQKRFFGAVVDILNENPISCNLSREITLWHPCTHTTLLSLSCSRSVLRCCISFSLRRHPAHTSIVIGWLLKCDLWGASADVAQVMLSTRTVRVYVCYFVIILETLLYLRNAIARNGERSLLMEYITKNAPYG
jgi:hypothetical protein